jgi:hypothetical protein
MPNMELCEYLLLWSESCSTLMPVPQLAMLFEGCGRVLHHVCHHLPLARVTQRCGCMELLGLNARRNVGLTTNYAQLASGHNLAADAGEQRSGVS